MDIELAITILLIFVFFIIINLLISNFRINNHRLRIKDLEDDKHCLWNRVERLQEQLDKLNGISDKEVHYFDDR